MQYLRVVISILRNEYLYVLYIQELNEHIGVYSSPINLRLLAGES